MKKRIAIFGIILICIAVSLVSWTVAVEAGRESVVKSVSEASK